MINELWLVSWYLICVLECLTKTRTKYKSYQDSNQRTWKPMNPVRVQKVGQNSEGCSYGLSRTSPKMYEHYQDHSRLTWHKQKSRKVLWLRSIKD